MYSADSPNPVELRSADHAHSAHGWTPILHDNRARVQHFALLLAFDAISYDLRLPIFLSFGRLLCLSYIQPNRCGRSDIRNRISWLCACTGLVRWCGRGSDVFGLAGLSRGDRACWDGRIWLIDGLKREEHGLRGS